jgi:GDP-6-deoxy-D-talose 4-dehydrogenase
MASLSNSVLITGIDGFSGRYLEPLLEGAGYQVFGTVQGEPDKNSHFSCDIVDFASVLSVVKRTSPRYVVHLAAVSFVPDGKGLDVYNVNLFGAINLLEALTALKVPPEKVVLASTATVYGRKEGVLDETLCSDPINHYAVSKLAMEKMARTYNNQLPIVFSRPFNYTGVGQADNFLIPKIVRHFRERMPVLELGNLEVERDFGDVRDAARAYRVLLESGIPDEAYNICTGRAIALEHLLEIAKKVTGHHPETLVNPTFIRNNEIQRLCGDNSKLKALGWAPEYTIEDTLEWMFKQV